MASVSASEKLWSMSVVKAATAKRRRVADAVGHQEQQRYASHRVQQKGEALFTAGVDPVQVFDHQH